MGPEDKSWGDVFSPAELKENREYGDLKFENPPKPYIIVIGSRSTRKLAQRNINIYACFCFVELP